MKRLIALPLLALAACNTTQPAVEIRTVEVPTPVACPDAETVAALKAGEPPRVAPILTGNAATDLPIVAGSALRLRAWAGELMAVVDGCGG